MVISGMTITLHPLFGTLEIYSSNLGLGIQGIGHLLMHLPMW